MKLAPLIAMVALALGANGATAQSPEPAAATPPANGPTILNAPKPATKPAATTHQPYAGQQPAPAATSSAAQAPPRQTTATPASPAPDSAPEAQAPPTPYATAPATEGAAAAAKAAASEAKSSAPVPEGPAVKPIARTGSDTKAVANKPDANKPDTASKADPKSEPIPTLAKPEPPKPTLLVAIDLTNQKVSVTENGVAKYKWSISSGRTGYQTPRGTFRPIWMTKMWYSRKYDYAPMPHSIFFHGGTAIHGTDSVYALGRPASHGCIRLAPNNAATLYRMVTRHGKQMTRITVFGTPKQTPVASRDDGQRQTSIRTRRYLDDEWLKDDDDYPPMPRRRVGQNFDYDEFDYERPQYRRRPLRPMRDRYDYNDY